MIYLDYNATTPLDPLVAQKMTSFMDNFGNPSSLYPIGRKVKESINEAREYIAKSLGVLRSEVVFTGSGTESDNYAILGVMEAQPEKKEFITSSIEHPAVLETARYLEKKGYRVTYLPVDEYGTIDLNVLEDAITDRTALISVMQANNEIGTIQPIEEVVRMARKRNVLVHTDAVQSYGKIDLNAARLGVDLLSVSAHKIYGPKGVGALYIRKGVYVQPLIHGGHQEGGLRAGTENTLGIVGFGEAARLLEEKGKKERSRIETLAEKLKEGIEKNIDRVKFNGHPTNRIKSTLNFAFPGIEAEAILLALATKEIYVSTGSACSEESEEASHVLLSIGLPQEIARSSVRFSLGRYNQEEHIPVVVKELAEIVEKLREISDFNPDLV